ncbi:hypothetical protein BJP25_07675 [Actinokineospora bangkokensis]|uniref:DUF2891 domain-containing protein n=1 Tax=Actinokineospora bangkokensis TaxID=1193682 RepID=A0A1Q9LT69_9PSEU|nr:hypothetical protein BJP25_07675 [Actinokineospora bangkokensis]
MTLDPTTADRLLATATDNLRREYPIHWIRLVESPADLIPHRELHPVFAGSYDWHSCVHQTWLAVRMLRLHPGSPSAERARATLDELITVANAQTEADFFLRPEGAHWERPYGWAWLLVLDSELRTWDGGARWAQTLWPLVSAVRTRWVEWLTSARRPVRVGTHTNTAFALCLALDAARAVGDEELAAACATAAHRFYLLDTDYGAYEPDAADFLSPGLTEADLMRRVLSAQEFEAWFDAFLPDLTRPRWAVLRTPVEVDAPADPHGSHLAGLALSRAWCWAGIAAALGPGHRCAALAADAAEAHRQTGWQYVFGYGYAAEHWLGTFAAYLAVGAFA